MAIFFWGGDLECKLIYLTNTCYKSNYFNAIIEFIGLECGLQDIFSVINIYINQ